MTTKKATPGPWEFDGEIIFNTHQGSLTKLVDVQICEMYNTPNWADNAALICKAVNRDHLFDELIKVAETLVYDFRVLDGIRIDEIVKFETLLEKCKEVK